MDVRHIIDLNWSVGVINNNYRKNVLICLTSDIKRTFKPKFINTRLHSMFYSNDNESKQSVQTLFKLVISNL